MRELPPAPSKAALDAEWRAEGIKRRKREQRRAEHQAGQHRARWCGTCPLCAPWIEGPNASSEFFRRWRVGDEIRAIFAAGGPDRYEAAATSEERP